MFNKIKEILKFKIIITILLVKDIPNKIKFCNKCNKFKSEQDFNDKSNVCISCKNIGYQYEIMDIIIKIICKNSNIDYFNFMDKPKLRKKEYMQIRQKSHYFSKKYTDLTLYKIGKYISNKDHSTVLHSIKTVNNMMETDKEYLKNIKELKEQIEKKLK